MNVINRVGSKSSPGSEVEGVSLLSSHSHLPCLLRFLMFSEGLLSQFQKTDNNLTLTNINKKINAYEKRFFK